MNEAPSTPSIAIVTDASADVPEVERGGSEWRVLREMWRGGGLEITDIGEHDRDLVRLMLGSVPMEVTPPGYDDFRAVYADLAHMDAVWSLHSPAQISPAADSAREAAGGFPNVRVVECAGAGIAVGLLAARARALAGEGQSVESIDRYLRRQARAVRFLVVPDRFDPAGGQRLLTATLLAGRPMLSARDGVMARSRRLRSRRATVSAIQSYLDDHVPKDRTLWLAVGHGDAAGAVDPFLDIVERSCPQGSIELVGRVGPRLVAQVGSRCVGLALLAE